MSAQQAFNAAGKLLDERYRRWDKIEASLPSWGDEIDYQVSRYIQGIKGVVQADLEWRFVNSSFLNIHGNIANAGMFTSSFKSHRYFGEDSPFVRTRGTITVMKTPPYMVGTSHRSFIVNRITRMISLVRGKIMFWVSRLFHWQIR